MPLGQVLRRLRRAPGFSVVAVLTLGLAIGANVAIFAVVNAILLEPLPFREADRLVGVWHTAPAINIPEMNQSFANHYTYLDENQSFSELGLHRRDFYTVTGQGEPEQVEGLTITASLLRALEVRPQAGRLLSQDDDQPNAALTVMLTYGYWQQRFGGSTGAIGSNLLVNGKPHEVIGVMPRNFRFLNRRPALLVPIRQDRNKTLLGQFNYQGLARLKPGVTIEAANADVARMLPMVSKKFSPPPGYDAGMIEKIRLGPLVRPLSKDLVGDADKWIWLVMGTVGIVLLIACANIANLMLVRGQARQQELSVRSAMGAGWRNIAWDMASESLLLGLAGGTLGVALAWAGIQALIATAPAGLPNLDAVTLSPVVLIFALAASLLSSVLFSAAPIWKYAGGNVSQHLRTAGRSFSQSRESLRTQKGLVIVQVALALMLVISSVLMFRTFVALRNIPPGFRDPEHVQLARFTLPEAVVSDPEAVVRMQEQILRKVEQIPGITKASYTSAVTMDGRSSNDGTFAEDRPQIEGQAPSIRRFKWVAPGSFEAIGNPLLAGRDFTWSDIYQATPVVLITENFAKEWWGTAAGALGKRIRENPKGEWREIIGVVANEYADGPAKKPPTVVYWPALVHGFWGEKEFVPRGIALTLRTSRSGSEELAKEIRQAVWSVNPSVPLFEVQTLGELYEKSLGRVSFTLTLLAIAGGMALLLGVIGIYGVLAYTVAQKSKEIGIRMALGADAGNVVRMFTMRGAKLAVIGVVCGVAGAAASTRVMQSLLYGVGSLDLTTFASVAVLVALVAIAASYVPARGAARAVPLESLKADT